MKEKNQYVWKAVDKLRGIFSDEFSYPRKFDEKGSFINLIFILIYAVKNNLVKPLTKEFLTTVIQYSHDQYKDKNKNTFTPKEAKKKLKLSLKIFQFIIDIEDQIRKNCPYKQQSIQEFYLKVILQELKYFSEGSFNPPKVQIFHFLDFINRNKKNIDFRLLTEKILEFRFSSKYSSEFLSDTQISSVSPHLFDIEKLKKKKEKIIIYNPFSGLGSFGVAFIDVFGIDNVKIINEEINTSTFHLSVLRYLVLYDNIKNISFINRDSLKDDFIPTSQIVGEFDPTDYPSGQIKDIDVVVSAPPTFGFGQKKYSKPIASVIGKLIKRSKFSMFCQYGSALTKFSDDIPFENLNKVVQFESSASKGITSAHTFCFMFEKQKVNRDINMIFIDRDHLVTNKDLINKLHLYERKPELIISSSHEEFFKSFVGIKMMMPLDIQLIWYQKNIRNKYKYKRIEDILLPIDSKEMGFATTMGIYNANEDEDKKVEKLMQLPYANPVSLFKNKLDFFTKKPDFSAPVCSDGMEVHNALRMIKVIKCSCILMHRRGYGFSYFDINENPEGLALHPIIAPIKLKSEFCPKYVISSMFQDSFKDQIDLIKDRNPIKDTQIKGLIIDVDENKLNQEKIFNKRRDEAINNFLDYRIELTDNVPEIPEKEHYISIEKHIKKKYDKKLKEKDDEDKIRYQKFIGNETHNIGNMLAKISSSALGFKNKLSKLKFEQKNQSNQIDERYEKLIENIKILEKHIYDRQNSINEFSRNEQKDLQELKFEDISDVIKKIIRGHTTIDIDYKPIKSNHHFYDVYPWESQPHFENFLIISNTEYLNEIFENLIKNATDHSKSKRITIDVDVRMLKEDSLWKLFISNSDENKDVLDNKYNDAAYFEIEFKFDGKKISDSITYEDYSKYGNKRGESSNHGIGGSTIRRGVVNSNGFFYYNYVDSINCFKLYFPTKWPNNYVDNVINDDVEAIGKTLWMKN